MDTRSYRVLLAICSVVILSTIATTTPSIQAAPPKVVCVPWYPPNLAVSHDTWAGATTTLKGTAHDPDGDADLGTYEWDFGDGSPAVSGAVTDPYIIEATHTYTGSVGDIYVATLTVTDAGGESGSDNYLVTIRNGSILGVQVNVAIDEGLWRLHKDMYRGTYGDGVEFGYLPYYYSTAATGAGVEAFEIHGHLPTGNAKEDPYVETVQRGLNYLLDNTHVHTIGPQTAGDPDTNGNGFGIGCYTDWSNCVYECGITLMTFASSKAPGMVALRGPVGVAGRSYGEIVQDMVDYMAFAQSEPSTGVYRGGWRYTPNSSSSDNSVSQWPVIGMEAAETTVGAIIPGFVRSELNFWIDYSQNDSTGGAGYTDPWSTNLLRTASLLCQMKFFGDDKSESRVIAGLDYITLSWDTDSLHFPDTYYAFYAAMKAFRLLGIHALRDGTDWYNDPARGYASTLVDLQNSDGSWGGGYVSSHPLSSAWALLTLQETVVEPGPVGDAGPDVPKHPPVIDVQFDGSGSYHLDSAKEIVLYEWDFEGDGVYDFSSSDPTAAHAYPAVYNSDGTINWPATEADYTVVLRVTDNSSSPKTDTDTCIVHITPPPWPPVADPGGPYLAAKCETITLNGSASYAPGGLLYPDPDHPWNGYLVSWEWDLDNDGQFDDATGETVEWMKCVKGLYVVGLRVTDNLAATASEDTVINVANRPPQAEAGGPYSCALGEITFDGSGSTDPDEGETETLEYRWDFESDGIYDTPWSEDPTATHEYSVCEEHTATLEVRDIDGATDTDTADVVPNRPPDDSDAYADPAFLWPPNHKMVPVTVMGVTDPDGDPVTITVTGITSDEPTASDLGSGGATSAPDADGVGTSVANLRAECSGTGNGRVYEVSFQASDGMGGICTGSVKVYVPHDIKTSDGPVDDGQNYDATQIN